MAQPQLISSRTEFLLSKLSLKAVNPEPDGRSTKGGHLTQAESAGQLGRIERAPFLTLAIWGGFAITRDTHELKEQLLKACVLDKEWFNSAQYLSGGSHRRKVDGMLYAAIQHLGRGCIDIKPALVAEKMGITQRAFHKTWQSRYQIIHRQLLEWLHNAAQMAHQNLK